MSDTTETTVTITIDGRSVEAIPGELVIDAAERAGTYIPRFCYHPRMQPVGMCRMCIVEIDSGRGPALQPSCMIPVAPDMVVTTDSDVTKKAQDGVLEFLLANHPLDCPVCDKGGECPLQDQAYSHGPGESRFVEEKRHFEKPIAISELVHLDRERCILCDRCTRFADEVAGDTLISFIGRGSQTQVNTFPDHPFASYFSGNTVQICPVGALTAEPYRFKARPWDLDQVESTCTSCSVGCRVVVQASRNEVLRVQGVDVDAVNWGWLCDKGRFDYQAVHAPDRLGTPMVHNGESLAETSWSEALGAASGAISSALDSSGPGGIAVLGGARLTNESAYAWSKLAKGVIGTDHVDAQLGDGLPADAVLGLPRATIDEVCAPGGTILLVGVDPKESLGALYLRLRHAVVVDGATLVELVPHTTGLSGIAAHTLTYAPGGAADVAAALMADTPTEAAGIDADTITAAAAALRAGPVRVVLGRGSLADSGELMASAAGALLDGLDDVAFLSGLTRGNVHGALDAGLSPGLLPGRVALDAGRARFHETWSTVPSAVGHDATGILTAAAAGQLDVLVLLGANPLDDFPDCDLATRALAGARTVIAVDTMPTPSVRAADVVLPAAGWAEVDGTTTNLEGRVSRVSRKVTAPGTARSDWAIAAELAYRLGDDLGLESLDDIEAEMAAVAGLYAGIGRDTVGIDGVVVPLTGPVPVDADSTGGPLGGPEGTGDTPAAGDYAGEQNPVTESEPDSGDVERASDASDVTEMAVQNSGDAERASDASDVTGTEATPAPMPTVTFTAPDVTVPQIDGYRLRLVTNRKLYDQGTATQASPALAKLADQAVVRLHPHDFDRLGVDAGSPVVVSNREDGRGSITVPVAPDAGVPKGAAVVTFNQAGGSAASLIDASRVVTDVRVEVGSVGPDGPRRSTNASHSSGAGESGR